MDITWLGSIPKLDELFHLPLKFILDVKKGLENMREFYDRLMLLKVLVGKRVVTIISTYAPQQGLSDDDKEKFYADLILIRSNRNGHKKISRNDPFWEKLDSSSFLKVMNIKFDSHKVMGI